MKVGMVSTRFGGLDGVSLEAAKVADALRADGHEFVWFAGELAPGFTPGRLVPEAHFATEENRAHQFAAFAGGGAGTLATDLADRTQHLEGALGGFVSDFGIEALMIQNASSIPIQLPLGLAIRNVVASSGLPTVAHHHDLAWERERFDRCAVPEILEEAFPPVLPNLAHVVINRDAAEELERRRGVPSFVLPNVMDFDSGPAEPADREAFRRAAGVSGNDVILLQPTRVLPRKGIELTIDLAAALDDLDIRVVVTHPEDLDVSYWRRMMDRADRSGVDIRLVPAGHKARDLANAYAAADLVCFPSLKEGFGNALIEAFFYRRPVLANRYPVYVRDIAPYGVECIELDGEITDDVVRRARRWITDPDTAVSAAIERNYQIGRERFSFQTAREVLGRAFASIM